MRDPRHDPVPDNLLEQVYAHARDLAYGALVGDWPPNIHVAGDGFKEVVVEDPKYRDYFKKWGKAGPPNINLLIALGCAVRHVLQDSETKDGITYHQTFTLITLTPYFCANSA